MNRRLQIMHILRDDGGTMKTTEIARMASTAWLIRTDPCCSKR